MRRYCAKASRSKSQVSMAWASRTLVVAHSVSEGNSASVPSGSAPAVPRWFIGAGSPSVVPVRPPRKQFPHERPHGPGLMRRAAAGPGA